MMGAKSFAIFLFIGFIYCEEATLSGCISVGDFYRCTATLSYTGDFGGESLNITRFSTVDGDYTPSSPIQLVLSTSSIVLATSIFNHSYPLGKWSAFGSCASTATTVVWDQCFNTYSSTTTAVPAPVAANGYTVNPCGNPVANALPPGTNSTFSPAFCPVNGYKGGVGIQKTATGQLFDAGINSKPGAFTFSVTYTVDGVLGTSTFSGTYGVPTVSTASPVSLSVTKYPAVSALSIPFWYEADNGTKYVPNSFVLQNYWNYPVDRDWLAYLGGDTTGLIDAKVLNANTSNLIFDRWGAFCDDIMFYCSAGVPTGIKSRVLTEDLWDPLPSVYSTANGQISTTISPGDVTATISIVALFKRLPPAVSLVSYTASRTDGYVAVHGINSGNAGSLTLSINYTSGPSGSINVNIPAGAFDFRIESRTITSICAGSQCLGILYAESNSDVQPANLTPGAKWSDLGASTLSEFIFRLIMIILGGLVIMGVMIYLGTYVIRKWKARRLNRYSAMEMSAAGNHSKAW